MEEGDCDDTEPRTHPGSIEWCDGEDNDCDGVVPADEADADGDGVRICAGDGDCDDHDPKVNFFAEELPFDTVDSDCDGMDFPFGCSSVA